MCRQLDTSPATIDVLPFIVRAAAGRVPVLVDGGVRRGTDVVKVRWQPVDVWLAAL